MARRRRAHSAVTFQPRATVGVARNEPHSARLLHRQRRAHTAVCPAGAAVRDELPRLDGELEVLAGLLAPAHERLRLRRLVEGVLHLEHAIRLVVLAHPHREAAETDPEHASATAATGPLRREAFADAAPLGGASETMLRPPKDAADDATATAATEACQPEAPSRRSAVTTRDSSASRRSGGHGGTSVGKIAPRHVLSQRTFSMCVREGEVSEVSGGSSARVT